MSRGTAAYRVVHLLSLGLFLGTYLAAPAQADDQNQRRKRQQQQQQQQQQSQPQQQPVYRPNVFVPQRYPVQPRQQQPYVQQPRFPTTQFQPVQPRTVVNPNVPIYRAPVANPNVPSRFSKGPNEFRANPNSQGQTFRQAPMIAPGMAPGRMPMPVAPMPTMPGRVVPINGMPGTGLSTLTRREVLSSPEDREFMRGLSAQQRQTLDRLTPEQIQSLQQSGQWNATKQAILAGRSPLQGTQSGAIPNPNGSGSSGPSGLPCPGGCPSGGSQTPGRTTKNGAAPPPTGGTTGNSGATNTGSGTANSNASGGSPNDMGPTAGAADIAPPSGNGTAGSPVGAPPVSPASLKISGFPSTFSASGGGAFQPNIPLNGSGFTTVTQIVWSCVMPNAQPCTNMPYVWTPQNWAGKFFVSNDGSASVAPHLLAGGDPAGVYQWTVTFTGNGGAEFNFQVNNGSNAAPPPAPPPPVWNPPSPPPVVNNPSPPPSSGQIMYIESGTGTQLTADQIRAGSFPPGTFFIESGTGQQVTQAQLLGTATPQPAPPTPTPPQPSPPPSPPQYTFNLLTDGNVQILQNGQLFSTGVPTYAAQFGYRGPGWNGQVATNNPPAPQPMPPTPPNLGPQPPASTPLQVNGFPPSYTVYSTALQPQIRLSGRGFNSITQVIWTCAYESGQPCAQSPYVWTSTTWGGRFSVLNDTSAIAVPTLLTGGDSSGTYQWTVTFVGNGQVPFAFQVYNVRTSTTQTSQSSTPSNNQASQSQNSLLSSLMQSAQPGSSLGNMSATTPSTLGLPNNGQFANSTQAPGGQCSIPKSSGHNSLIVRNALIIGGAVIVAGIIAVCLPEGPGEILGAEILDAADAETVVNQIPVDESQLGHIFQEHHLLGDPKTALETLSDLINNNDYRLGPDKWGNEWYAKNLPDGSQLWSEVRNNLLKDAGINPIPRIYNPMTGLKLGG